MSNRTITIVIDVLNQSNGKLKPITDQLLKMDAAAQKLNNKIKAIGLQRYAATLRLVDKISEPASRINSLLKKLAGGAYRITMRLNDLALAGIRKVEGALARITGRAYNIALNVQGAAASKLNGLASGAMMGAGVFAPMAGMMGTGFTIANAIQSSAGFEKEMSKVQALRQLDKDSVEMKQLTQQAKDLGMTTAWTRQQVAEAMKYQSLAGWEVPQILAATPHLLNLASAGDLDLGRTSDIVTDAMTAFGLKVTEDYTNKQGQTVNAMEHFSDMLAKLQASSNTDISQAGEAFKYSANVIGAMFSGKDIQQRMQATEDSMIMTGLMANAGIKGSMAGTAQRAIFTRMASMNRNSYQALRAMGVEYQDKETGDILMPGEIMRNLSRRFKEGVDPTQLIDFAEAIQGEKIHADTRRKLDSFIEQTMKNQGKMSSADMAKMSAMLAGQEAMSGLLAVLMGDWDAMADKLDNVGGTAKEMAETQLDNLAGSFVKLGSAWDAFQQDLFTGTAGQGLRNFVDALTEILTRANKLFADGIDIPDFAKIFGDIIDRLKNKFLEFDGIGSILAGGALAMGLKKIISLGQSALNVFKGVGAAGATALGGTAAKGAAGAAAGMGVSTMNVKAGVVNLAGAVKGGYGYGGGGGRGGYGYGGGAAGAAASPMAAMIAAQKQFDKTNTQFLAAQAKRDAKWGKVEQLFAAGKSDSQLARARATARKFDETRYLPALERQQAAQKALVAARVNAYNEEIARQKQMIALAREQGQLQRSSIFAGMKSAAGGAAAFAGLFSLLDVMSLKSANAERLAAASESERAQVMIENRKAEWEAGAGAAGSIFGAAAGAALGSMAGPMGTMIGGMIGSMIGETIGKWFGRNNENSDKPPQGVKDYYGFNDASNNVPAPSSWADFRRADEAAQKAAHVSVADFRKANEEAARLMEARNKATAVQLERFEKIDRKHGVFSPFAHSNAGYEYYHDQGKAAGGTAALSAPMPEITATGSLKNALEVAAATIMPSMLPDLLWSNKAHAAELNAEQMAQMAAMEGGTVSSKVMAPFTSPEMSETPDISAITEQIYSDVEALQQGVSELFADFGEQITANMTTAFEGVGEMFTAFGTSITEGLTSTFEGASEMFANFGTSITEGLTATFTNAGEIFIGFNDQLTTGFTAAQTSTESALTAIQTSFTTAKDTIQSLWTELPGFFNGIFGGLGGAAAAAGAAIEAGLTAPIGSVVGAWSSAAAQISAIISSISAQAAAVPSIPAIGGNIPAHARGGFVTAPEVALIGEAGPEAIIPLSPAKRPRALELLEKTESIVRGESTSMTGDLFSGSIDNEQPEVSEEFAAGDSQMPVSGANQNSNGASNSININLGDFSFSVDGSGDIIQAVREKLNDVTEIVAAKLSENLATVRSNQPLVA